jgi:hypothetical protein
LRRVGIDRAVGDQRAVLLDDGHCRPASAPMPAGQGDAAQSFGGSRPIAACGVAVSHSFHWFITFFRDHSAANIGPDLCDAKATPNAGVLRMRT